MSNRPETIGSDVGRAVNEAIARSRILHYCDPEVISIFDQIDKLEQADEVAAARLRGYMHHMCGNIHEALDSFGLEFGESTNNPELAVHACAVLSNLGYTLEAQSLYRTAAHPQTGNFSKTFELGVSSGSFQTLSGFIELARRMHLSNLERLPSESMEEAASILRRVSIDDTLLAKLMGLVGTVLREHGLMFLGSLGFEVFNVPDEATTVRLRYTVDTTTAEALGLEMAFVDKLIEDNISLPPEVTFTIQGSRA